MSKTYYMHTLNGHPAEYDGRHIVYANFYGKPMKLVESLAQIKRERKASEEWRYRQGFVDFGNNHLSHRRVRLP